MRDMGTQDIGLGAMILRRAALSPDLPALSSRGIPGLMRSSANASGNWPARCARQA